MNLREYAQKALQQPASAAARDNCPDKATDAYKGIYRAVYDFHKRYAPFPQNPEAWQTAAQELAKVSAAAGNNPFANSLLLAVMEEMERRWKDSS